MISFISGNLVEKTAPFLVVDVNGVGYEIQASLATFSALPNIGEQCKLLTHFVVREDAQLLFGFGSSEERKLFRALIKISGVGPKLALGILSGMSSAEFAQCISAQDIKSLVRLPGVGKKTAERLVVEMKDRMAEWMPEDMSTEGTVGSALGGVMSQNALLQDAEAALIALGYSPTEASKALAKQDLTQHVDSESLIRAVLKNMLQR